MTKKSATRAAKKLHKKIGTKGMVILILVLAILAVGYYYGYTLGYLPPFDTQEPTGDGNEGGTNITSDALTPPDGEIEIHFLELGNKYTGDCTYIRVGEVDVLIDAGSRVDSITTISTFLNDHMKDDVLDYVVVTHAHQDHYAGFATSEGRASLFDLYEVGTIIDFARTNQKSTATMYSNYIRERDDEIKAGAEHYTARECIEQGKEVFQLSQHVTMKVLDSKYYYEDAESENDYSVCLLFSQGEYHYLFTGDLEEEGEKALVEMNDLPKVMLYKAGHHGSKTSSSQALMSVIQPEVVCVCCCAGSPEYTKNDLNQFPTQAFIDRVSPYTDKVYVTTLCEDYETSKFTSMNGNITVSVKDGVMTVTCSASDKILKEWDWFKEHRTTPNAWK